MKNITINPEHIREIFNLVNEKFEDGKDQLLSSLQHLLMNISGIDPSQTGTPEDAIKKAKDLAFTKHAHQTYGKGDSIVSYSKHLEDVVSVLKRFGYTDENYIIAGYLHDSIEDTDVSYNDIRSMFGEVVADMVYCVTDELGKNRKERKAKTYAKIAGNRDAIIIKLADRIANLEYGIKSGSDLVQMYQEEHNDFTDSLYVAGFATEMWKHLSWIVFNPAWYLANCHDFPQY